MNELDAEITSLFPFGARAFSSDLNAAWMLVQAMHDGGYWLKLQGPFEKPDEAHPEGHPWNAGFSHHSFTGWNGRAEHRGQGKTAPEAICRAVLALLDKRAY